MREHYGRSVKFLEGTVIEMTFQDGKIIRYDMADGISVFPPLKELQTNRELFLSGKLLSGYGIIWNEDIDFNENIIYEDGEIVGYADPTINDKFGELLQVTRLNKGLSQTELSKLSGIDQGDISRLEKGEGNPTLKKIGKAFKAMGVNLKITTK